MKKAIAMCAAVMMLCCTACGNTDKESGSPAETTAEVTTITKAATTTAATTTPETESTTATEALTTAKESSNTTADEIVTDNESITIEDESSMENTTTDYDLKTLDKQMYDFISNNGAENFDADAFSDLLVNTLNITSARNVEETETTNTLVDGTSITVHTIQYDYDADFTLNGLKITKVGFITDSNSDYNSMFSKVYFKTDIPMINRFEVEVPLFVDETSIDEYKNETFEYSEPMIKYFEKMGYEVNKEYAPWGTINVQGAFPHISAQTLGSGTDSEYISIYFEIK